jgi:hypothetical protein
MADISGVGENSQLAQKDPEVLGFKFGTNLQLELEVTERQRI